MSKVAPLVHVTWVAMFCTLPQPGFFLPGQPVSRWDQVLFVVNGGAVPCCFARKIHTIRQPNLGAECGRVRGKFCQHLKTFAWQAGNQKKLGWYRNIFGKQIHFHFSAATWLHKLSDPWQPNILLPLMRGKKPRAAEDEFHCLKRQA